MNKIILMGRLTRDPEIKYTQNEMMIARYTLAVDRRGQDKGADFISCVAFDKSAQFANKYLHKGMKIAVTGRIQTGSYERQDGTKVYTTDVIVNDHEFCESKASNPETQNNTPAPQKPSNTDADGFMSLPDGFEEGLPFA